VIKKLILFHILVLYILFLSFLFVNIIVSGTEVDGSEGILFLIVTVLVGLSLLFVSIDNKSKIFVKHYFFWFCLFYAYMLLRIVLDLKTKEKLFEYTVTTTGGSLLFFILGIIFSVAIDRIRMLGYEKKKYLLFFLRGCRLYQLVIFVFLIVVFLAFFQRLRSDIFLIVGIQGAYQRAGNFLIINYLLSSFIYILSLYYRSNLPSFRLLSFDFTVFLVITCFSIVIAQMMGSNMATGVIGVISVNNIVFHFTAFNEKYRNKYIKLKRSKQFFRGRMGRKLFLHAVIFTIFIAFIIGVYLVNINVNSLRIFGFGKVNPLAGRLVSWGNFTNHFMYSPITGNMNVHILLTGPGSYVHSFIGSLLTHTGVVGFILFSVFYSVAVYSKLNEKSLDCFNNYNYLINSYSLICLTVLMFFSVIGTFFIWIPIWFSWGFYLSPVSLKQRKNY